MPAGRPPKQHFKLETELEQRLVELAVRFGPTYAAINVISAKIAWDWGKTEVWDRIVNTGERVYRVLDDWMDRVLRVWGLIEGLTDPVGTARGLGGWVWDAVTGLWQHASPGSGAGGTSGGEEGIKEQEDECDKIKVQFGNLITELQAIAERVSRATIPNPADLLRIAALLVALKDLMVVAVENKCLTVEKAEDIIRTWTEFIQDVVGDLI